MAKACHRWHQLGEENPTVLRVQCSAKSLLEHIEQEKPKMVLVVNPQQLVTLKSVNIKPVQNTMNQDAGDAHLFKRCFSKFKLAKTSQAPFRYAQNVSI